MRRSPIRSADEIRLSVQSFRFLVRIGYLDPTILVSPVTVALSRVHSSWSCSPARRDRLRALEVTVLAACLNALSGSSASGRLTGLLHQTRAAADDASPQQEVPSGACNRHECRFGSVIERLFLQVHLSLFGNIPHYDDSIVIVQVPYAFPPRIESNPTPAGSVVFATTKYDSKPLLYKPQ